MNLLDVVVDKVLLLELGGSERRDLGLELLHDALVVLRHVQLERVDVLELDDQLGSG